MPPSETNTVIEKDIKLFDTEILYNVLLRKFEKWLANNIHKVLALLNIACLYLKYTGMQISWIIFTKGNLFMQIQFMTLILKKTRMEQTLKGNRNLYPPPVSSKPMIINY